jgi:hypothetical protein
VCMAKTYCMICGKEKDGIAVEDDYVLRAIRWFKSNVTRNEQGNRLAVCKDCYAQYKKERKRYESRRVVYAALAALFFLVSVATFPRITTVAVSLGVCALLYLFSLMSYVPKIALKPQQRNQ